MTFFFNYAFEPFNVEYSEHKMNYFWISIIHSITPVFVLFTISIVYKLLKLENKWNIAKEAVFIFIFFLTVGLIQFLIRDIIYENKNNWSLYYLYDEIRNTFLIGSLFVIILTPFNFNRLNAKHKNNASSLNITLNNTPKTTNQVDAKIKINDFEIEIHLFMFAKSEGNYIEIYLNKKSQNKKLVRSTLKNLETLFKIYPNIIKTHRSYLVNSNYIENIKGNAQGYQLKINHHIVPVSRNMIKHFNLIMKHLKQD
ncbi:LytTR family DNA-binding domain-containing protein [uncultured Maribacter sp.]|uniref:LytTR family DNA-binding domain-containing protein n=1 Tax=uncultured Maribacter sp. TaxID=431308 RepID=UPI00260BB1F8|nr:LytTR family DNA-binding domain-containing protein [uncultured Maribacter sp.]